MIRRFDLIRQMTMATECNHSKYFISKHYIKNREIKGVGRDIFFDSIFKASVLLVAGKTIVSNTFLI